MGIQCGFRRLGRAVVSSGNRANSILSIGFWILDKRLQQMDKKQRWTYNYNYLTKISYGLRRGRS